MSTKKPNSPEPKQSPKADAVIQDKNKQQGNPKQNEKQAPPQEKPGAKNEKDKAKPAEHEKGAKPKDNKPAPQKGKHESPGAFLTEAKIPPPKPENVLVSSGLLEAYDYLQKQICKHGLPMGNAFEFAAITFLKYERKLKAKEADKRVEVTNKEKEKKVEVDARHGRSPRGHSEEAGKNVASVKSPQGHGRNQKEEEHKGGKGGKGDKSPPHKEEEHKGGKGGKGDKNPPPKEEEKGKGKGGKDDKERSKSPNPKDMKKDDHVINPKDQKDPKKGAVAEPDPKAKKK